MSLIDAFFWIFGMVLVALVALRLFTRKRSDWSNWSKFPDPNNGGILRAPLGPGVYQLRNKKTKDLVLFGMGENTAMRMTSLLSSENGGAGTRQNDEKQRFVAKHLGDLEYRTYSCKTREEAKKIEDELERDKYVFST